MGPGPDGPMGAMGAMEPHHMNGSLGGLKRTDVCYLYKVKLLTKTNCFSPFTASGSGDMDGLPKVS